MKHAYTPRQQTDPIKSVLLSFLQPVRAAREGDALPGWQAWLVHVVGVWMIIAVWMLLLAWSEADQNAGPVKVLAELLLLLENIVDAMRHPGFWAVLVFVAILIEGGWSAVAILLMPWSARDEKIKWSYRRALRRLWLITPHAATVILFVGAVLVGLDRMVYYHHYRYGYSSSAIDVDLMQTIISCIGIAAGCLWWLRVVLAGLSVNPAPPMSRWPARCRRCGYALAGLSRDQTCPECGESVRASVDPNLRPGMGPPGGPLRWLGGTWRAIRRPTNLGGRLHVLSPDPAYRRCLTLTIAALMTLAPLASAGFYLVSEYAERLKYPGSRFEAEEMQAVIFIGGFIYGLMMVATTVGTASLGALLSGAIEGYRAGRNLMPAAIRASCYQSGFALIWAVVVSINIAVMIVIMQLDLLSQYTVRHNLSLQDLLMMWQGGVVLLGVLIYVALIGRATRAARYANW